MQIKMSILREMVDELARVKTRREAWQTVRRVCRKYRLTSLPRATHILQASGEEGETLRRILLTKPVRAISGVVVITVVPRPAPCPGRCAYCPDVVGVPKSYTGSEPAMQRAIRNGYDPFLQVRDRLDQYELMGHLAPTGNKCEVIVLGGTFMALGADYRRWFVKRIFDALNGTNSDSLTQAHQANERASCRCVNLTFETRPDYCGEGHVDDMLGYGVTKVELGVQSVYPHILKLVRRGHTLADVVRATRVAKNAALKVGHHYMPGLPGSDLDKDLQMFRLIFENPNLRPDYLKIYPTLVIGGTQLHQMWAKGKYTSYSDEELIELLAKAKRYIPPYCRIQRLGRAMSIHEIEAGYTKSNLRELVQAKAVKLGISCRCIRCREVGFRARQGAYPNMARVKLVREDYEASGGHEIFISFEDVGQHILLGYLRLRIPGKSHRSEIDSHTALVRELKVLGTTVPIGASPDRSEWQHRGYGRQLLEKAEQIALDEFDRSKMVVMSAVGTRWYYRRAGYESEGPYVSKFLT